jgi:hypothetical protein
MVVLQEKSLTPATCAGKASPPPRTTTTTSGHTAGRSPTGEYPTGMRAPAHQHLLHYFIDQSYGSVTLCLRVWCDSGRFMKVFLFFLLKIHFMIPPEGNFLLYFAPQFQLIKIVFAVPKISEFINTWQRYRTVT